MNTGARRAAAKDKTALHSNRNGLNVGTSNGMVARTTVVFPAALNANWEAFALKSGRAKAEILADALRKYLEEAGLQPDKLPTVKLSYAP